MTLPSQPKICRNAAFVSVELLSYSSPAIGGSTALKVLRVTLEFILERYKECAISRTGKSLVWM